MSMSKRRRALQETLDMLKAQLEAKRAENDAMRAQNDALMTENKKQEIMLKEINEDVRTVLLPVAKAMKERYNYDLPSGS